MNTFPEAPKLPCPANAPMYRSLLPELRAGTLSQREQEAVRGHLLICKPCRDQATQAADHVIENAVRQHYGVPADGEAPFLTLDDIRRRAAIHNADGDDTAHRAPIHQHAGERIIMLDDNQTDTTIPEVPVRRPIEMPNRWRTLAAVVATVVLISLFALLLRGFASDKSASGLVGKASTPTTAASSTRQTNQLVHGKWQTVDGLTYTTIQSSPMPYPVFSPKDPAIVYETSRPSMSARRSDDGGATWHALQLPPGSDKAIDIEIFASPLDAHTAFLTVTVNLAYGQSPAACPSSALASVGGATHGNILASGQVPCSTTYRTTDEGKTWKAITFPAKGTISTPYSDSAPYAGTPLQAQGTRLYAMLTCGPTCMSAGGRLVSSDNGGATWHVADAGGLGQGVCDFAAQPTGQTIFAAVSRGSCDVLNSPTLAIDRSDNGGQSWAHASYLPQGAVQGMAAVIVNGKSLLVVSVPAVSWQPHMIGVGPSASQFLASDDGGRTWKTSPLRGVPDKAQPIIAPLIVRADGSLVVAFAAPNTDGKAATLYAWKAGAASWRVFAPAPNGDLWTLLHTNSSSGETFWAVLRSGFTQSGNTPVLTFNVASYHP